MKFLYSFWLFFALLFFLLEAKSGNNNDIHQKVNKQIGLFNHKSQSFLDKNRSLLENKSNTKKQTINQKNKNERNLKDQLNDKKRKINQRQKSTKKMNEIQTKKHKNDKIRKLKKLKKNSKTQNLDFSKSEIVFPKFLKPHITRARNKLVNFLLNGITSHRKLQIPGMGGDEVKPQGSPEKMSNPIKITTPPAIYPTIIANPKKQKPIVLVQEIMEPNIKKRIIIHHGTDYQEQAHRMAYANNPYYFAMAAKNPYYKEFKKGNKYFEQMTKQKLYKQAYSKYQKMFRPKFPII